MRINTTEVYLLLGGNVGDRIYYIQKAIEMLNDQFKILKKSSVYETEAWGDRMQNSYFNVAVKMEVTISAEALLDSTDKIERILKREEKGNYQPRTIDIDILFYGLQIINTCHLCIPHKRLHQRNFVLTPLNEIAPDFKHPILNKTIHELQSICKDKLVVNRLDAIKV